MEAHEIARALREALRCDTPGCGCRRPNGLLHCPAHDDRNPSLSLTVRGDRVLVHCHAGCSQERVIEALRQRELWPTRNATTSSGQLCDIVTGHEISANACGKRVSHSASHGRDTRDTAVTAGLTLATLAEAKRLPVEFLRELGLRDVSRQRQPAVRIPYYDESGTEVAVRYRLALTGDRRFAWRSGTKVMPYGLDRLDAARRAGWVLVVEGESDCWVCWFHGIPALGLPGKSTWRSEWRDYLAGLEVFMWQEPDAADFPIRIGQDVPTARVIVAPEGIKDIADAHVAGEDVTALVERLKAAAVPVADLIRFQRDVELAALEAAAAPVLEADDPLLLVERELRRLGYGGDLTPAMVTYLALTTRLLAMRPGAMPAHLLLVGPPSAGKSYTVQTALRLMPPEAYHVIDAGSPRVLIYDDADLQHRALIFGESDSLPAGEDNPAASAIRNLLQDHRLHYRVTVRDPETGHYTVREIDKPGPTVLVTTAIRELGDQLTSRVFVLPVPEDGQRIRDALAAQAELEINGPVEADAALICYQAYVQRWAPWDVVVPFAQELADAIARSTNATRIMRDYQRVLALIKGVALLRHRHRSRWADGRLVATIEDYATVYRLVGAMYEASVGASEQVRAVVQAVADLRAAGAERVTYSALAQKLNLHREQVKRLAKLAMRRGWLVNNESRPHQPADLEVGEPLPERYGLPRPEELASAFTVAQGQDSMHAEDGDRWEEVP